MALTVLRPNGDRYIANVTLVGYSTAWQALADDSDSTWVQFYAASGDAVANVHLTTLADLAPGHHIVGVRVRVRFNTLNGTASTFVRLETGDGLLTPADFYGPNTNGAIVDYTGQTHRYSPAGREWSWADISGTVLDLRDNQGGTSKPNFRAAYVDVFTSAEPVTTITAPANGATITDDTTPTITGTYSQAEGFAMNAYEIKVFAGFGDFNVFSGPQFNPDTSPTVWTSGVVAASGTTFSREVSSPLTNGPYRAYARTRESVYGYWSPWVSREFTINVVPPNPPGLVAAVEDGFSRVELNLSDNGPELQEGEIRYFDVERSETGAGNDWTAVERTYPINLTSYSYASTYRFLTTYDYEAKRDVPLYYRARVRSVFATGQVTVSNWTTATWTLSINRLTKRFWWLKSTSNPGLNIRLNIHSENFVVASTERQGVFSPLGRRNAIVLSDVVSGERGSFELSFLDQASYDAFEKLRGLRETLLLQSPYGDHMFIRLGSERSASFMLNHGGAAKRVVTVNFIEVDEP